MCVRNFRGRRGCFAAKLRMVLEKDDPVKESVNVTRIASIKIDDISYHYQDFSCISLMDGQSWILKSQVVITLKEYHLSSR